MTNINLARCTLQVVGAMSAALLATTAHATNGMNMEGYGPISTALGGASQAIEHGTAAVIQNPATLSLMSDEMRADLALGLLGPRVSSRVMGMAADSSGTRYVMPALGYVRRSGAWSYGIGVFGQGGMGTEYGADSFLAVGSGSPVRSELSVGRLILPASVKLSSQWMIGATLDYVWGGLDLRMAATGMQLGGLVTGAAGNLGSALPALAGAPWARVDFSNDNDFTGAASTTGWAGKIGVVYAPSNSLRLGFSHHFKTSLSDMKTGATAASLSAAGGFADAGRVTVIDFQWPATTAIGLSWQLNPALLVAADVKRVRWSGVMKDFRMRYDSASLGGSVNFTLPQNWKDQSVFSLGGAYRVTEALTLRAGVNMASNPVPDAWLNPLFPATVERHLTLGFGFRMSERSEVNASFTFTPTARNSAAGGVEVSHQQRNAQLMYSYRH